MTITGTDRRIERTLLIDADDTLWENNIYYLRCTARFAGLMESLGLDGQRARRLLEAAEREVIPAMGYGPEGYIQAVGLAYERLASEAGLTPDPAYAREARACAEAILDAPMVLLEDVAYVLRALRPTSRLVLVTKGDAAHQFKKLERSGLGSLFDATYILEEKDADAYRHILRDLGLDRESTWMVGNSPRSDINPAVEAGLGAVLIPHDHTWTAEVERLERPEVVITLNGFCDLLELFTIDAGCA
ncbi:MAG: HAD family hydrolase [Chloroflexi bacterium]|nr:HAD family hydrolase [Chloroflexota bacterium]